MNKRSISLIILIVFSVVCVAGGVLAGPDSVNWGNMNLNYKPPKQGQMHGQFVEKSPTKTLLNLHFQDLVENKKSVENYLAKGNLPKDVAHTAAGRVSQVAEQAKNTWVNVVKVQDSGTGFLNNLGDFGCTYSLENAQAGIPLSDTALLEKAYIPSNSLTDTRVDYSYRPGATIVGDVVLDPDRIKTGAPLFEQDNFIFADGFESGDVSSWSSADTGRSSGGTSPTRTNTGTGTSAGTNQANSHVRYDSPSIAGFQSGASYTPTHPVSIPSSGTFGLDQPIGTTYGLGGPLIACGKVNNVCTLAIYDSNGALVSRITRNDLERDPTITGRSLWVADNASRLQFSDGLHNLSHEELVSCVDLSHGRLNLNDTGFFKMTDGHNYSNSGVNPLRGCGPGLYPSNGALTDRFEPSAVFMPQLGLNTGEIFQIADVLNSGLSCGRTGYRSPSCFDLVSITTITYIIDPITGRVVKGQVPDDPLYIKGKGGTNAKKAKKGFGIALGGAAKIGGGLLGVSSSSNRGGSKVVDQWGIREVGFTPMSDPDSAWNVIDGSEKNVLVAVIDSGLDFTHPDGPEYIWTNPGEVPDNNIDDDGNGFVDDIHGWNFMDENNDLTDFRGHGTQTAGIIAAKSNNGIGIAGINPGAEIMVLKVTDEHGNTNNLQIYRALKYAANHGARVINVSLGDKGVSQIEQLAINYATMMKGALVVVAAGNEGDDLSGYGPASASGVIAVGGLDVEQVRSGISNFGANLSVIAPADQIYSLHSKDAEWDGPKMDRERRYEKISGTSFSAPMVAATASLILAKNPKLTNMEVEDIILATAMDMEEDGWDEMTGTGLLDASAALRADVNDILSVKITNIRVNKDRNRLSSVDVFGSVRGNLRDFIVEAGRGKKPKKWEVVAGPFKEQANYTWITHIDKSTFKGGSEWTIKITATDKAGKTKTAEIIVPVK